MRKHVDSPAGQDFWKAAKLERALEEAQKLNKELLEQLQAVTTQSEVRLRMMYLMLYELGGSIEVSQEDLNSCEGKILASQDEKTGITVFFIEGHAEQFE